MATLNSLCKRRGFVFQSCEIYGGTGAIYDFGPLGLELRRNIKDLWWKENVYWRDDMVGVDAGIITHPKCLEASGHVAHFKDPMVDCKGCKKRFRADQIPDKKKCHECGGELTEPRMFNLMFKTHAGAVEDDSAVVYLRPETAQGIFVNFANVLTTSRKKLPFGIAQIGKSFRNEVTTGDFLFRLREFEQMEIEYFVKPGDDERAWKEWVDARINWYYKYGIKKENLKIRHHEKDELAHYAKACIDIEYNFPMGFKELEGIANRTDFDLKQHMQHSKQDLSYFDDETKQHVVPYVIEPSAGVDRIFLAFLCDAYKEEIVKDEKRVVLSFHPLLAPIKIAVLPLLKKRGDIVELGKKITMSLKRRYNAVYDDTAAIGRLYRRQDEIGTPLCVTVDVDTVEKDKAVTIRERDTMQQIRVPADQLETVVVDIFENSWASVVFKIGLWQRV